MGRFIDISGQSFGSWRAISVHTRSAKRGNSKAILWNCVCKCGQEDIRTSASLRYEMRKDGCKNCSIRAQAHDDAATSFWIKVDKSTECWLWKASTQKFGYGVFNLPQKPRKTITAHRMAWELTNGKIPEGMCVLHKCDVPSCVNPEHLFLGDRLVNNRDRVAKGRCAPRYGVYNGHASLTEDQVREIRKRISLGHRNIDIAKDYGIRGNTISNIKTGVRWSKVI